MNGAGKSGGLAEQFISAGNSGELPSNSSYAQGL